MRRPSGSGAIAAGSGRDSPVRTLRSKLRASARVKRGDRPEPRRRSGAGRCRPEPARGSSTSSILPAPPDAGDRRRRLAQRLERLLAAVLGHDARADDRGQDHQHEQPVADFVEGDSEQPAMNNRTTNGSRAPSQKSRQQRGLAVRLELIRSEQSEPRSEVSSWCEAGGRSRRAAPERSRQVSCAATRTGRRRISGAATRRSRGRLLMRKPPIEPGPLLGGDSTDVRPDAALE